MGVAEANTALQAPSKATSESVEALLDVTKLKLNEVKLSSFAYLIFKCD